MKRLPKSPSVPALSRRRRFFFWVIAVVVLPAAFLGGLEIVLRLCGYGYSTALFKRTEINHQPFLVNNDEFGYRFFPREMARTTAPIRLAEKKPAGTYRIFILGESAAMGDPEPAYGAGRYLEALLNDRYPRTRFEIVNLGITAINSHVILPIARDAARCDGDLWIIYMGNNEMVGPFGAATVFGKKAPPLGIIRLNLAVLDTRIGQLLDQIGQKLMGRAANTRAWGGMEMFINNRVLPDDPRRATVYQSFARNLNDILRIGMDSGAAVLLNTVVVNLADCPPLASEPGSNGSTEVEFREGRAALVRGDLAAARQHLQQACDIDALPFRADTPINDTIRAAGQKFAGAKLRFFDAAAALANQSPAGVCGEETFYEHVHFNFAGSYRLGRAWAEQIEQLLPREIARSAITNNGWATPEQCEERLGVSDWNRSLVYQHMIGRMQQPPLSGQPNNAQRIAGLQAKVNELERAKNPAAAERARASFLRMLERTPDDFLLRENFALFLHALGDLPSATAEWRRVHEMLPDDFLPYYQIGKLLGAQGQWGEAEPALRQAVARHPGLTDGWIELGNVLALQGKSQEALATFATARQQQPQDPQTVFRIGKVWANLNRYDAAAQSYREAIQLNPVNWEYHYELAGALDTANQLEEACREFAEAVRLNPSHGRAHFNYGILLAKRGRLDEAKHEFEETIRLEPEYTNAQVNLAKVHALQAQRR